MNTPLTNFLAYLAEDSDRVTEFNKSVADANGVMDTFERQQGPALTLEHRQALLAHDAATLRTQLLEEGFDGTFTVACGPTADGAAMLQIARLSGPGALSASVRLDPPPTARPPRPRKPGGPRRSAARAKKGSKPKKRAKSAPAGKKPATKTKAKSKKPAGAARRSRRRR